MRKAAGITVVFAIVVKPWIMQLNNRQFQVIDGIIQKSHPLFLLVWLGSSPSLLITAALAPLFVGGQALNLVIIAIVLYIGRVPLPGLSINMSYNSNMQE